MPTLNWIGKDKVINHHLDVPFRVLDLQYTFSSGNQEQPNTESENKIIRGDNLEALKALLPRYEGKIKCIYIDPPYNTGNEGWVYNDNVNDPKFRKWLGQVVGKEGEDLSRHVLLKREGWTINVKRVYRLYKIEGLNLRNKIGRASCRERV